MNKKKKIILAGISLFILAAGASGAYIWQTQMNKGYESTYTFEEVNERLFEMQKKAITKLEDTFNEQKLNFEKGFTQTGDVKMDLSVVSLFVNGTGSFQIPGYTVQAKDKNIDYTIDGASVDLEVSGFIANEKINLSIEETKGIINSGGLFTLPGKVVLNTNDSKVLDSQFKGQDTESIDLLNKVSSLGKYLHIEEKDIPNFEELQSMSESIIGDSLKTTDLEKYYLDILKNEPLFEVLRQDETKYYLTISKKFCNIAKGTMGQAIGNPNMQPMEIAKYILFLGDIENDVPIYNKENFGLNDENCSDKDRETITKNFSGTGSASYVYIESNTTHAHISYQQNIDKIVEVNYDTTIGLLGVEESQIKMNFLEEGITGSGILLYADTESFSGYVDIANQAEGIETNILFTPTEIGTDITGKIIQSAAKYGSGSVQRYASITESEANITGSIVEDKLIAKVKIQTSNKESVTDKTDSDTTIDISIEKTDTQYMGNISVSSTIKIEEEERSGNGSLTWDYSNIDKNKSGNVKLDIDITELGTLNYELQYSQNTSDTITSDFATPENIMTMEELEDIITAEAKKIKIKKMIEERKRMKLFNEGKLTLTDDEKIHYNGKTTSDARALASAIEIRITEGVKPKDLIVIEKKYLITNVGTLYVGEINYDILRQNKDDFKDIYGNTYKYAYLEGEDIQNQSYQIQYYHINSDNKQEKHFKGNYFQTDDTYPKNLFMNK